MELGTSMVFDRMREQLARVFGMNWAEVSGESTLDVSAALLDDSQVTFFEDLGSGQFYLAKRPRYEITTHV